MGVMWIDRNIPDRFPVYKRPPREAARHLICDNLGFPAACIVSDDILDAHVANLMATDFISGKAEFLNDPSKGSYVVPKGHAATELSELWKELA